MSNVCILVVRFAWPRRKQMFVARTEQDIEALVSRYRTLLRQRWPHGQPTLEEIETLVEEIQREVTRDLTKRIVDQQPPPQPPPEKHVRCSCGALARYHSMAERRLITRHGEFPLIRPYYYCPPCAAGFAPLDAQLGLDRSGTTFQIRRWVARMSVKSAFAEAAADLEEYTGVQLSVSHVERIAVHIGSSLARALRQQSHQHQVGGLPLPDLRPARLYISMDGKMVPLRDPWRRDGSQGALACRYGECKTGVVYEAEPGPKGDQGVRHCAYVSTMGKVGVFGPLIGTLAHTHGHHRAREVVVLGDGAPWIWQIAATQFPSAVQILDYYHATQHLWSVANAWFGEATAEATAWMEAREAELKADQVLLVLRAIREWKPRSAAKRQLRDTEYQFIANNAERMRYRTFREKGYHIGSGVVESACGHVVGQRLDEGGMHWREETADAIVCLRAALRSTHPPDLRPHYRMAA
jgi:hypothetical protein